MTVDVRHVRRSDHTTDKFIACSGGITDEKFADATIDVESEKQEALLHTKMHKYEALAHFGFSDDTYTLVETFLPCLRLGLQSSHLAKTSILKQLRRVFYTMNPLPPLLSWFCNKFYYRTRYQWSM